MRQLKRRYVIEPWIRRDSHGWMPFQKGDCRDETVRFFVFSSELSVRHDRLHGRDFRTMYEARAAIADAKGIEDKRHDA